MIGCEGPAAELGRGVMMDAGVLVVDVAVRGGGDGLSVWETRDMADWTESAEEPRGGKEPEWIGELPRR
jgi:hypothetical protein